MAKKATIAGIIKEAKKYLPNLDEERVVKAYEFAKEAHKGQKRSSGEPYIIHPLEVTKILLTLKPDEDSIITALLHDVLEDTEVGVEEIRAAFGESVIPLCKGLEKLSTVYYSGKERQIENLRKMFIAMAKDIRVILIKLADRLHNMRTLEYVREDKQKRIAEETLNIYSPIAARLGIYRMKNELDDLGFRFAHPIDSPRIFEEVAEHTGEQENIIKESKKVLMKHLRKAGVQADVTGRVKNPFSIYKKLKRKDKNYVQELYDVLAMRIIVEDEAACYQTLGVVHRHFTPLSRRFKDYIANPKPNGYQSLHTTVVGIVPSLHNRPIEIQIRSREMDEVAKFGIAAHWQYKEQKGRSIAVPEDKIGWIQNLVDLHENLQSNEEFIDSLSVDTFKDRIFAITPNGDAKDLPYNATPVDFAYAIHTEVGHKCKGAKVNGKIVPLDYNLKNGQVVDILTTNEPKPNRYWLSFVTTSHAKTAIKSWFNALDKDKTMREGKELVNAQLKRFGQPELDPKFTVFKTYEGKKLSLREREQLVEKIGNGSVNASTVVKKVIPTERYIKPIQDEKITHSVLKETIELEERPEILITGEKGLKTTIATCCAPKPPDKVIGYVTRGRGITIHNKACKIYKGNDPARLIKASWNVKKHKEYEATLEITRKSRIGLLRDVAAAFAENELPIIDIDNINKEGSMDGFMIINTAVDSLETLTKIIDELEAIDGIISVKKMGR